MEVGSQNRQNRQQCEIKYESTQSRDSNVTLNQDKIDSRILYRVVKNIFDRLISMLGIILLSPLFIVVAILIKNEDGGKVIYVQQRIGKNGKPFKMYKFRSMVMNADKKVAKIADLNEVDGAMFKMKNDPRVTKVGKVIRKYSIDELPQLVNVVKGDMALVGPRPPLAREVKEYSDYDMQRLMVVPGCTGLWQVTERNSVGFHEMVELDIEYIQKSNFLFDLGILIRTVWIMIKPNEAY
ncbi:sugar transferase [Secundilactobacillus pentosiphilus]|nr:sugar transferase [Secundilactobacillus pentosiphilus]